MGILTRILQEPKRGTHSSIGGGGGVSGTESELYHKKATVVITRDGDDEVLEEDRRVAHASPAEVLESHTHTRINKHTNSIVVFT